MTRYGISSSPVPDRKIDEPTALPAVDPSRPPAVDRHVKRFAGAAPLADWIAAGMNRSNRRGRRPRGHSCPPSDRLGQVRRFPAKPAVDVRPEGPIIERTGGRLGGIGRRGRARQRACSRSRRSRSRSVFRKTATTAGLFANNRRAIFQLRPGRRKVAM